MDDHELQYIERQLSNSHVTTNGLKAVKKLLLEYKLNQIRLDRINAILKVRMKVLHNTKRIDDLSSIRAA